MRRPSPRLAMTGALIRDGTHDWAHALARLEADRAQPRPPPLTSSKIRIGLANQSKTVTTDEVKRVAAALSVQVKRDLLPIWGVDAVVVAMEDSLTIPKGVSPIIIVDQMPG